MGSDAGLGGELMAKQLRSIEDLQPDAKNANLGTERGRFLLEKSFRELGAGRSVVTDAEGRMIGGNKALLIAEELDLPIEVIQTDGSTLVVVQRTDLDLSDDHGKARQLAYFDNRTSEVGLAWSAEQIVADLDTGVDLDGMFREDELRDILEAAADAMLAADQGPQGQAEARQTLAERFIVPPFSVLDARQGYWQDRKRAWIALGIQSELGRGEAVTWGNAPSGMSTTDATKGYTERGKGLARTFGQDLMRGEGAAAYKSQRRQTALQKTGDSRVANSAVNSVFGPPENAGNAQSQTGTSIFDPVLCECVYTWFCPPNGNVIDPFAGGSVRGIVAAKLGRRYTGVDLSERQIEANRVQWAEIGKTKEGPAQVAVSGKWARHLFNCTLDNITSVCKGSCCQGSDRILVSLLPDEAAEHEAQGYEVRDGLLQPVGGLCPHKQSNGLCGVHGTNLRPFGCIASPFTLNDNDTLIVRNRYSRMKCHGQGYAAYKTFRPSLDLLFGEQEAERICAEVEAGAGKITATMPCEAYDALHYLDSLKHGAARGNGSATWHVGDGRDVGTLVEGEYDLLFTCPPYADLEVYSDDPRDLSTMDYADFLVGYREIIAASLAMLKPDRFACVCVGDVRAKDGLYRNLVSDTIAAFQDAGAMLYNEAILVTAVGSLPIRVGRPFVSGRKLGKTHQNVLVFVKGDWRKATEACGSVDIRFMTEDA